VARLRGSGLTTLSFPTSEKRGGGSSSRHEIEHRVLLNSLYSVVFVTLFLFRPRDSLFGERIDYFVERSEGRPGQLIVYRDRTFPEGLVPRLHKSPTITKYHLFPTLILGWTVSAPGARVDTTRSSPDILSLKGSQGFRWGVL